MKLYGIKTLSEANIYLEKFLEKINLKFAKPKEAVPDVHRAANAYDDLDQIICWQYRRQLRNDWTIQFKREYYQIKKGYEQILNPGEMIVLKRYLDGTMRFWYQETELDHQKLSFKPEPPSKSKKYYTIKGTDPILKSQIAKKNKKNTPWNQYNPNWLKVKEA